MSYTAHAHIIQKIGENAIPLDQLFAETQDNPLHVLIRDARYVLIGEATHGTEEFYHIRAELTKLLITHYGFSAVAVEGDWPDCYRANRYVRGDRRIADSNDALREFTRFPSWMWQNNIVAGFLDWLRAFNAERSPVQRTGFYGLDLYSLYTSMQEVIRYLEKIDPDAAARAREHYACFDRHYELAEDPQKYGYATMLGLTPECEYQVSAQLVALRERAFDYMQDGVLAEDAFFCAEQNAKLVQDAEKYYREMFRGRVSSWNLRDKHMVETLYALSRYLSSRRGEAEAKVVVWAHNSHIGDARATEMGSKGEWNIGQLMRQAHGDRAVLIGFSTHEGTVTAASEWDGGAEKKTVRPAIPESCEALFHEAGNAADMRDFLLLLRGNQSLRHLLDVSRLERAIGVLYKPETERASHYFFTKLPEQFDALIHIDQTHALTPLETTSLWHGQAHIHEETIPETYPSGL